MGSCKAIMSSYKLYLKTLSAQEASILLELPLILGEILCTGHGALYRDACLHALHLLVDSHR